MATSSGARPTDLVLLPHHARTSSTGSHGAHTVGFTRKGLLRANRHVSQLLKPATLLQRAVAAKVLGGDFWASKRATMLRRAHGKAELAALASEPPLVVS